MSVKFYIQLAFIKYQLRVHNKLEFMNFPKGLLREFCNISFSSISHLAYFILEIAMKKTLKFIFGR